MADAIIDDWISSSNYPPAEGQPAADGSTVQTVPEPAATTEAPAEPTPEVPEQDRDSSGKFRHGHRARSHAASPEDIPRISKLTARAKTAEEERDRIKTELEALKAKPAPAQSAGIPPSSSRLPDRTAAEQAPPVAVVPQVPLTRAKPTEDQIGTTYNTYADFVEDLADWRYEQREARSKVEQATQTRLQHAETRFTAYQQQKPAFLAAHADYPTILAAVAHIGMPPVMMDAVLESDRPHEIEYWLGTHADEFASLAQEATGLPHTAQIAKMIQRVLESKLPGAPALRSNSRDLAGSTGSAAPRGTTPAPRPPNPVRTGATPPAEDIGPGDDHSFEDHERLFGRRRRR